MAGEVFNLPGKRGVSRVGLAAVVSLPIARRVRGHDEIVPRTKEPTAFKWPFGAMFGLLSRTLGTIRHTTVKTRLEKA